MFAIPRVTRSAAIAPAKADLSSIAAHLEQQYPETNGSYGIVVRPLRENLIGDVRNALYILFGTVVCVLLIANVNVANLLLARASVRAQEIALRTALGASRARIIRQL